MSRSFLALSILVGCFITMNLITNSEAESVEKNPVVVVSTDSGDIEVELYPEKAPKTVENFLAYANEKFYDGTVFHRVIKGFMIQGGGMTPDMKQKDTKAPIVSESNNGLKNMRGTIAMARTNDPNSATSQFFINHKDNAFLDYKGGSDVGYTVFGKVISGIEAVDKIAEVKTGSKGFHQDVPVNSVIIKSVSIKKAS